MTINTILSKPLPVVWFRAIQLIRLKIYYRIGFWSKIEARVKGKISKAESEWKQKSQLFSKDFDGYDNNLPKSVHENIIQSSCSVIQGNIQIFDVVHPLKKPFDWHTDWRFGHKWKNRYFKEYSFYEKEKDRGYDVKFPWELSRMSFLIPVARRYLLENKKEHLDYVHDVLYDWKKNNPLANSVNWYPMEVSVRSINLVQLREILLLREEAAQTVDLLNEILILHGVFLWRNIEFTDVRGNHYAANLTALLLLGNIFNGFYGEANRWKKYALAKIEKEFHLQFIGDGVNFEKSTSYHRLVVEFFLICFLVMHRMGIEINLETKEVFKNACMFIKDVAKPNLQAPIIGDNDSASVFLNECISLNNHATLLQLASLLLKEPTLSIDTETYISTVELFGLKEGHKFSGLPGFNKKLFLYPRGGFCIVKDEKNYFITDVGEVGMKGRGGHGHNDLYSFELMLNGKDIIVDPGCYTYTGDLKLKNEMKSSRYHNILTVDDEEIAPMVGDWGIADIARPLEVEIKQNDTETVISGKHEGYMRLQDPVRCQRIFSLEMDSFQLSCIDMVKCNSGHKVTRHLHLGENVDVEIMGEEVIVKSGDFTGTITFDQFSTVKAGQYQLSYNYGHGTVSKKLVLESKIKGDSELFFNIKSV